MHEVLVDNDAARIVLARDIRTRMIAMRKTHRINVVWTRQLLQRMGVLLKRIGTDENLADTGTKPLPRDAFEYLIKAIMHEPTRRMFDDGL